MCCLAVAGHLPSFAMIPFRSDRPKVAQPLEDSFAKKGYFDHFQHKSNANSMALFQCAVRGDYYNVAITLYFLELICVRWMPVQGYLFASLDM